MENTKTKAIISLVCSIVGVVLAWFGLTAIGSLVLGIIGVVMAVKVRKANDENRGMATAALVLGIISIVLGGIMTVCALCAVCVVGTAAGLGAVTY